MEPARFRPRVHVLVCVNARAPGDPLASGCGAHGPAVYAAMKRAVSAAGRASDAWVTRTLCLGHCPPRGCAVAVYPGTRHYIDATERDAQEILDAAMTPTRTTT